MPKTSYQNDVEPKLSLITAWARNGIIDKDIAFNLGIAYSTLRRYSLNHEALKAALSVGKDEADMIVVNALYQRALGQEYEETKITIETTGSGKNVKENKKVEKTKKWLPPSTTAQIYWLKNRIQNSWRDNPKDPAENNKISDEMRQAIEALYMLVQNPTQNRNIEDVENDDSI